MLHRIHYDKVTGRVLGISDVLSTPDSIDDIVEDVSYFIEHMGDGSQKLVDNLYFIDGQLKVIENRETDYYDKRQQLCTQIASKSIGIRSDSKLTDRIISGMSLEDAINSIKNDEKELEILKTQLDQLDKQHSDQLNKYYEERNAAELQRLSPQMYSCVCLLIKDENKYLEEWIYHYIDLGVDHIVIYDNGADECVDSIIRGLDASIQNIIDIIDYHDSDTLTLQEDVYMDFIDKYSDKVRWVAFVDSDEFIEIVDGSKINEFLKNYEEYGSVFMNWIMYDADGQIEEQQGLVKDRFTHKFPEPKNHVYRYKGKDFIQLHRISRVRRYHPKFKNNSSRYLNDNLNMDVIKLNHYYTKSLQEWAQKIMRGSCDSRYLKKFSEFFKLNPDMEYLNTGEELVQKYNVSYEDTEDSFEDSSEDNLEYAEDE